MLDDSISCLPPHICCTLPSLSCSQGCSCVTLLPPSHSCDLVQGMNITLDTPLSISSSCTNSGMLNPWPCDAVYTNT